MSSKKLLPVTFFTYLGGFVTHSGGQSCMLVDLAVEYFVV